MRSFVGAFWPGCLRDFFEVLPEVLAEDLPEGFAADFLLDVTARFGVERRRFEVAYAAADQSQNRNYNETERCKDSASTQKPQYCSFYG